MHAVLAIVGFIAFLGALDLLIVLINKIRTSKGREKYDIDASVLIIILLIAVFCFIVIGELYDKVKGS